MSKESTQSGGIGFLGVLAIVFIVLKLTKYIDWSWWWVLSPVTIPLGFVITLLLIIGIITFISNKQK
ncbi:hypothetical protein [Flavobacterium sp.]|uniref:hypothetical protein n=1 Tax=Flavobacterium sp. TaxID=239 RepID=UPI0037530541